MNDEIKFGELLGDPTDMETYTNYIKELENSYDVNTYDGYANMKINETAIIKKYISEKYDMTLDELDNFIEKYELERTI